MGDFRNALVLTFCRFSASPESGILGFRCRGHERRCFPQGTRPRKRGFRPRPCRGSAPHSLARVYSSNLCCQNLLSVRGFAPRPFVALGPHPLSGCCGGNNSDRSIFGQPKFGGYRPPAPRAGEKREAKKTRRTQGGTPLSNTDAPLNTP